MFEFTRALGVRCSFCHKGVEGQPLSTYDFASDDNPNKNRAREMVRMVADIKPPLEKVQVSGEQPVNVWCYTCHRGRPRPTTLVQDLNEEYKTHGIKAALDDYADLKKRFYGRGSYDFGEDSLNTFGYQVLEKDASAAVQVFRLNTEVFSDSGNVWDSLGEAYMKAGDMKMAEESYQKSLKLDPKNENAANMLKKIRGAAQTTKP
jgi:tetratricopeptide (TPR) repeat protein